MALRLRKEINLIKATGEEKNECAITKKDNHGDYWSHRTNLRFKTWILNIVDVTMCKM